MTSLTIREWQQSLRSTPVDVVADNASQLFSSLKALVSAEIRATEEKVKSLTTGTLKTAIKGYLPIHRLDVLSAHKEDPILTAYHEAEAVLHGFLTQIQQDKQVVKSIVLRKPKKTDSAREIKSNLLVAKNALLSAHFVLQRQPKEYVYERAKELEKFVQGPLKTLLHRILNAKLLQKALGVKPLKPAFL